MNILIFLLILLVLVLIHEFGHFITAKKFGIRVDEFGFGFPPKVFGRKYGETEYTFNALPFGGFVKIFGENPDEENTTGPDANRSFVNKPKWQQAIVLFAGIFFNFILAWILFSIVFFMGSPLATNSIPSGAKAQMTEHSVILGVLADSPAEKGGLVQGDVILSLATTTDSLINPSLPDLIKFLDKPDENIRITYLRNNKENYADVVPKQNEEEGRAFIGIAPGTLVSGNFNLFESVKYGLQTSLLSFKDTLSSFGKLFKGGEEAKQVRDSVIGPVGLVKVTGFVSDIGFGYLISFMALISISLAVINLLPFPALDGGRLLFLLIEKIKGSRINPKIANMINTVGFTILIALMLIVTYNDIARLF